jgi:hypothetical protein
MNPTLLLVEAVRQKAAADKELKKREAARVLAIQIETMKPLMAMWDDVKDLPVKWHYHNRVFREMRSDNNPAVLALPEVTFSADPESPSKLQVLWAGRSRTDVTLAQAQEEFVKYCARFLIDPATVRPRTMITVKVVAEIELSVYEDDDFKRINAANFGLTISRQPEGVIQTGKGTTVKSVTILRDK